MKLSGIKPEKVFEFFELLCSVPHGSDNTKQISDLCCRFARERGLEYYQDELNNVIIYKPASAGKENCAAVIIQGHLDMVAVKTERCRKDLLNDGLDLAHDGKFIRAEETSLGADDGIAVAMALAVLDDDSIVHPPIEAVFTVNEETGMDGAHFIDPNKISGRIMLNIDSEEEGIITSGCAGGARVRGTYKLDRSELRADCGIITISNLTGGHSGNEIDKGRANSNKLMGELLSRLDKIRIISVNGGEKDNAIANKTVAEIAYFEETGCVEEKVRGFFNEEFKNYFLTDPDMKICFEPLGVKSVSAASRNMSEAVIGAICRVPDGVQKMSGDIEGLVQTSLNFGVLRTDNDTLSMTFCLRSSVTGEKTALIKNVADIIKCSGGTADTAGEYPAWEFNKNSELRKVAVKAFKNVYGREPEISVIHAGLECGLFSEKLPGLDCISFGPDIHDIHTTSERLDIVSAERTWRFLLEMLRLL